MYVNRHHVPFVAAGLAMFSCFVPVRARADMKECAQAHAEAQRSMRSGGLRAAREQLKSCARDACITPIRKDCVAWLDEVTSGIPSIVVDAKDPDGKETFDVTVKIGETVVVRKLDVRPIELDPGTFHLRFERVGSPAVEKDVVLREGQRNKVVSVTFTSPGSAPAVAPTSAGAHLNAPAGPPSAPQTPAEPGATKSRSVLPWITVGLGGALAGAGSVFWLMGESDRSDLETRRCTPNCDQGSVDAIKSKRLVGDILVGAGVVAIGAGVIWLVKGHGTSARAARVSPTWAGITF
jgi:hypothetical protein